MVTLDEINQAIADRAPGSWQAGETAAWRRGATAGDPKLFGLRVGGAEQRLQSAAENWFSELLAAAPPTSIDWRRNGHVTPVKDQGSCGSCVAFAMCATMESAGAIRSFPALLSEGHLFHCGGGSCADGWEFGQALEAAKKGVGLEADLPWNPDGSCIEIKGSLRVTSYKAPIRDTARKRAVARGPVLAGMSVYQDFLAYRGGIYRHVVGEFSGNHAVCVVGYDDAEGCWIVKNSWGTDFGEAGFFRIAYEECGIDTSFPFYAIEVDVCT